MCFLAVCGSGMFFSIVSVYSLYPARVFPVFPSGLCVPLSLLHVFHGYYLRLVEARLQPGKTSVVTVGPVRPVVSPRRQAMSRPLANHDMTEGSYLNVLTGWLQSYPAATLASILGPLAKESHLLPCFHTFFNHLFLEPPSPLPLFVTCLLHHLLRRLKDFSCARTRGASRQ